jgi:predicted DNA-binding transcriptional regulator YafY
VKVAYDSIGSGITERVIFPHGLYASQGYWYSACFDYKRGTSIPMRADRFLSAERVEGFEPPPGTSLQEWMNSARTAAGDHVAFRARVTERGRKSFELMSLVGRITPEEGGIVETEIPLSEIDYYASRLLSVGTDILVEYPPELIEAIQTKTRKVVGLYQART